MSCRLLAALVAFACAQHAIVASAREVPEPLAGYRVTSWTHGDGIVLGEVRSIAQDGDGYLWLASEAGLVRFDGFRFVTTDIITGGTRLPAAPTRAVYVARDGRIWTGYGEGHGVYEIAGGEVRGVHLQQQISRFVNVITEDRRGTLWVGHDEGLHRYRDGRWERIALGGGPAGVRVTDVHEDATGVLWVVAAGVLSRLSPAGTLETVPGTPSSVRRISEDAEGRLWTTDDTFGFRRIGATAAQSPFVARGFNVAHDRRGNLWVTTLGQGLWQVSYPAGADRPPRVSRATVQTGLINDESSAILEDRDGNVWVGTIQGLSRLTPHRVTSVVDIGVVRALALGADGTAWAGTTMGLFALRGVTARSPGAPEIVSSVPVRALHIAGDGTVWTATDEGLFRVRGRQLEPAPFSGARMRRITSIESDRRGTLWVCDETDGLLRLAGGAADAVATGGSARALFTHLDRDGRLWIAFEGGTVSRRDPDGRVERYGPAQGLSHATVNVIHSDRRGGLWIGGSGGVSFLQANRFSTLTFRNEVWARLVKAVFDDEAGGMWLAFAAGFMRIDQEDIARALRDPSYALPYPAYNPAIGAVYLDRSFSRSAVLGPNDEFWFATGRGVNVVDLSELRKQYTPPPPPVIEGFSADDRPFAPKAGELPPRTDRLRIDYTVVNVSSSGDRVRFRYRLDGFDSDWVDGTVPRQATYTGLPPGNYRFRVQASTDAADWNGAEASWPFTIAPTWYQTAGFRAALALVCVIAAVAAWQFRVRGVRKELAGVFAERLRLSREIHDTLLQSLVGLSLDLTAVSRRAGAETQEQLVTMRRQVEEYIREVRQSIWDLRSPILDRHGLVGALRVAGEQLTSGKVRFAFTTTGTLRPCPPQIETHVLRIAHEAVVNAVRHAEAKQVQMEVGFEDRLLRLRVADDGRGVVNGAASPDSRHYGLITMQERAADAGGRCRIESIPGLGVQVVAEFPLPPA